MKTAYDFLIRPMEPMDTEAVSRLEQQIFTQPWSRQGFLYALEGENLFFVVQKDAALVAYCGMYCAADEGEIVNVAVKEDCRQEGIGRAMLTELLSAAKAAGLGTVVLEVRVSNQAAIHLYETLGFTVCGRRKGFYEQPREDGYVMQLQL